MIIECESENYIIITDYQLNNLTIYPIESASGRGTYMGKYCQGTTNPSQINNVKPYENNKYLIRNINYLIKYYKLF